MSTINTGYNNYYNSYGLFGSSSSYSSSSASSNLNSIYDLLSQSYGVNTASKPTLATNSAIRSAGESLSSIIKDLRSTGSSSPFSQINAVSDNEKAATATIDKSKFKESNASTVELNVAQVATAQVNSGSSVANNSKAVSSGLYRFEIEVDGKKHVFSVNVSASDNNDAIQQKMATAVNDAKIGVTASINYDTKNKTQTLKLTSAATGNKNSDGSEVFTVRDTTGKLAETMGITKVSQEAQNAMYSIGNGPRQYSASNKIDLGNGVTANLAGAGSTKISFEKNGDAAIDKVKELVSAINSAMTAAAGSTERGSSRMFNDMFQMTKAYSASLNRIGIEVSSGGVLSIDEDKLKAASKDGSLQKMFQGNTNAGFANRIDRMSNNMKSSNYYADPVASYNSSAATSYYDKYSSISSLLDMYY